MTGVIEGGWEYVHAAYRITAAILIGYVISILVRLGNERARALRERRDDRP